MASGALVPKCERNGNLAARLALFEGAVLDDDAAAAQDEQRCGERTQARERVAIFARLWRARAKLFAH